LAGGNSHSNSSCDAAVLSGLLEDPEGGTRSYVEAVQLMSLEQLQYVAKSRVGSIPGLPNDVAHGMLQRAAKQEIKRRG